MTRALGLLMLSLAAGPLAGQGPRGVEAGIGGMTVLSHPVFVGAGPVVALRSAGRVRLLLAAAAGAEGGVLAARGELAGHFLLNPARRSGAGCYALGGIGAAVGPTDRGVVVLGIGLEGAPGGSSGWSLEAGVGGGVRLALGWRIRWLKRS